MSAGGGGALTMFFRLQLRRGNVMTIHSAVLQQEEAEPDRESRDLLGSDVEAKFPLDLCDAVAFNKRIRIQEGLAVND